MNSAISLIDAVGVEHCRVRQPARIVSLVPSITELLFALGLGPQVVGRTTFCIHPADAVASVQRVGGTKKVRLDRLRALSPTHVIVNIDENQKTEVEEISTFVPHVIVTHPIAPTDNLGLYRLLGGIFDRAEVAANLCAEFESVLGQVKKSAASLPQKQVLYLIWYQPWMTISRATYIAQLLSLVNWLTPDHGNDLRYPELSSSRFGANQADLGLFSSDPFPFKEKHVESFHQQFGLERDRLLFIDGEMTSWYGCRAIEGLRYLRDIALAHG